MGLIIDIVVTLGSAMEHIYKLALYLERKGCLARAFAPLPKCMLDKQLYPHLDSFPYYHFPYKVLNKAGVLRSSSFIDARVNERYDKWASKRIEPVDCYIGKSGYSLHTGKAAKERGAIYICDRASTHILYQDRILRDEYERLGLKFNGINDRAIEREISEYENADLVFVPSDFVKKTFELMGISDQKIRIVNYGADIDKFKPIEMKKEKFIVLYVGAISVRKGVVYLFDAIKDLDLPDVELWLVGPVERELEPLIKQYYEKFRFMGVKNKRDLAKIYAEASVLVQPSIEEGLSLVILEAISCGLPVIATENTGASEILTNDLDGFIIKARSPKEIKDKVALLYEKRDLAEEMGGRARRLMEGYKGWQSYCEMALSIIEDEIKEKQ